MIYHPNAKINLGLNVTSSRTDGYHNLETVFYPIPLCDTLSVSTQEESDEECSTTESAPDFVLHTGGIPMNCPASHNLIIKVLRSLKADHHFGRIHISLLKRIPSGAGLGGGSSDAAFMLKALNQLLNMKISGNEMEQRLTKIGADCAFFIRNKPMFATGIGNELTPVNLSLKGWNIVIIKPQAFVSTPKAYSLIHPQKPQHCAADIINEPVENWKETLHNDFEQGVFSLFPQIGRIKAQLYDLGATYAAMSGSGSAVFGLFRQAQSPNTLHTIFKENFIWQCRLT